jgi:two-component system chemotaxis response regulator CheY
MKPGRVVSVGQCAADNAGLAMTFQRAFGAEVVPAETAEQALALLGAAPAALVLVNRVFDRDGSEGLDFIRRLKADEELRGVPVMLVSNYPDAQEQAVRAGAEPGFGKASLGLPDMLARVKPFLEA